MRLLHRNDINPFEVGVLRPQMIPLWCGVLDYVPDAFDLKIVTALEEESSTCEQKDRVKAPHLSLLLGSALYRGF